MISLLAEEPPAPRSFLYVPGDQDKRLTKALERGADTLILDLEDAVAPGNKELARRIVAEWCRKNAGLTAHLWVRINSSTPAEDIESLATRVAGIMVPNVEIELLNRVDMHLESRERSLGVPVGSLRVIALVETARGLLSAAALAGHPRVDRLAIGRADLAGELGLDIDPEGPEFRSILLDLVIASAAAGIEAPVAPTSTDFADLEALRRSTEVLRKLGYRSRTAVHPTQLQVINEVFTPSAEEIERARRIVALFEAAQSTGSGVTVDDDGHMVDVAVIRGARDVLKRAGARSEG